MPSTHFTGLLDDVLAVAGLKRAGGGYAIIDAAAAESVGSISVDDVGERHAATAVAQRAAELAAELNARHATILAWSYDASHGGGGGPGEDSERGPVLRYRAGLAATEAADEKAKPERVEPERRETAARLRDPEKEWSRRMAEAADRRRREIERMRRDDIPDDGPE